jgi:DUF4097 and DUF4098 domain-containing protein YvlB
VASPVQAAPIRPRRSLAGPFVLIVLGIVFLLGTMGMLQWYTLGRLWAHYWPVLIILWGVIKLLEYHQAQREGTRPSGIGGGQVLLLIVVIFFGLAATQAARFNWGEIRDQINIDDGDFPLFGHTYSYEDQLQQEFPVGGNLHVVNDRGAVNVTASNENQIRVVIHKRISADKQEDADKWNTSTKPQINVSDRTVSLNANTQSAGDHWVTTDMDVSIPRKASVMISTRRGDVSVLGRDGEANISSKHGDVSLADINGKVSLDLDHSSARISQIAGDVSIEGHANDVSLQDIKGTARLNGEFMESVKLAKIANTVSFKSSRTDLEFSKLDGDLDLDSGDLRASNLIGPLRLSTRSKDVRLDGVSGDVRLEDNNGAVELRMTKLGSVQVENRRGDIQIYVPDKVGFQVDARARNGEIQSDFNELKVEDAHDQATAAGTVGGGGPRLIVTNEHGTIEIRKGSSAALITPTPPAPPLPKEPGGRKSKTPEPTEN